MAGTMESVRCVNQGCRAEIPAECSFCPLCGADQRPPTSRPAVLCPQHGTLGNGRFCTHCGAEMVAGVGAAAGAVPAAAAAGAAPVAGVTQAFYVPAGVRPVQLRQPTDLWAWLIAVEFILFVPLLLAGKPAVLWVGAFIINALLVWADYRDTESCGYEPVPFIAGLFVPPVYLGFRCYRLNDRGAYVAVWAAFFALLLYWMGLLYQAEQASQDLKDSLKELQHDLNRMPD